MIAYCTNKDCPFKDCDRHIHHIIDEKGWFSFADFAGICERYITWLVKEKAE